MTAINLLIHCDLEAMPLKVMPTVWREPSADAVRDALQPIEVLFQSPPCWGYSRPVAVVLDEPPEEFASWGPRK